ncbi:MAG: PhzF family phenazine biosynthesis protein [Pseudomonadales bacterium]|jgi:PhzF family phenazine biosynthesis protein|nr:PhzF family phenazine biosynthesis protein [Pseudomonadales bacterium]
MKPPSTLPLYVVNAFTSQAFHGNPAAVCPLEQWLSDDLMQAIAAQNNLSETAFLVPEGPNWRLRWFTPRLEVALCGHATLASAFVLARRHPRSHEFHFHTQSGELTVTRENDHYTLNFPTRPLSPLPECAELEAALGHPVQTLTQAGPKHAIAELENESALRACHPDFSALKTLPWSGIAITARGDSCDFVSRYFAPKAGIDEDPVTGSAHCGLTPYWAQRLGKTRLKAQQLSERGGELLCELRGDRVLMTGGAVLYSEGMIYL